MKKIVTYYDILGVKKDASIDAIKEAYRKKAKEYHPDVTGNSVKANKKMAQVNTAYKILSDPVARTAYDKRVEEAFSTSNAGTNKTYNRYQGTYARQANYQNTNQQYQSSYNSTHTNTAKPQKKSSSAWKAFIIICVILGFFALISTNANTQSPLVSNTVSTPTITSIPSPTYSVPQQIYYQNVTPTVTPIPTQPTIDCTGPDGKHLNVTQKECDDFNAAWKPTPTATPIPIPIPQQNNYNAYPVNQSNTCSACGANSHCSFGSCVCNDSYSMNFSNYQCEACPANSTGQFGACTCNAGYQKNFLTGQCEACPPNSQGSYGICTCNNGYSKNFLTGQCVQSQ